MIAAGHPTVQDIHLQGIEEKLKDFSVRRQENVGEKSLRVKGCVLSPSSVTGFVWIYEFLMRLFTAGILSA